MRLFSLLLAASLAAPGFALAQTTTTTKMAPTAGTTSAAPAAAAKAPMSGTSSAAGGVAQYSSEAAATSACSGDTVVWANASSKALHMSGDKYYGKTKHGFYTCQKQALASGYHVGGKHGTHHKKVA